MNSSAASTEVGSSEMERLKRLHSYGIIQRYEKAGAFQHIVGMAAHAFGVPVAVVNLVDREKVLTRSSVGYENLTEVARESSICSRAILSDQVTVFEDAGQDPCLIGNPFVHGEFGLRFYAAAPLRTLDGYNIGVLAIADTKPRRFPEADARLLEALAAMVMGELEEQKTPLRERASQ